MTRTLDIQCATESDMQTLGADLARQLKPGTLLTLSGELGAGKSVLARSILHELGYVGHVKSPTYTLIESYDLSADLHGIRRAAHLDLYRLSDADELHYIGLDEALASHDLTMIEWPENGAGVLPVADILVRIDYAAGVGRCVRVTYG